MKTESFNSNNPKHCKGLLKTLKKISNLNKNEPRGIFVPKEVLKIIRKSVLIK